MFSVAITTYNRPEMTTRAIKSVINDPLCADMIVVDDHSTSANVIKLINSIAASLEGKRLVTFIENPENIGMSRNKNKAIFLSKCEKVLILDSDNYLLDGFLAKAAGFVHMKDTILMPEKAMPEFNYADFASRIIDKHTIKEFLYNPIFQVMLNTCNYIVPRELYHKVYQHNPEIKETDTLWFNYLWLKAGYKFFIVPGMEYIHEIHEGSGWLQNADYNLKKSDEIIELINQL